MDPWRASKSDNKGARSNVSVRASGGDLPNWNEASLSVTPDNVTRSYGALCIRDVS